MFPSIRLLREFSYVKNNNNNNFFTLCLSIHPSLCFHLNIVYLVYSINMLQISKANYIFQSYIISIKNTKYYKQTWLIHDIVCTRRTTFILICLQITASKK